MRSIRGDRFSYRDSIGEIENIMQVVADHDDADPIRLELPDEIAHQAIRFDQEDQNALWLYRAEGDTRCRSFTKILTGPAHPDYKAFCLAAGHGTGYQDQIIIEMRDFLEAIATGRPVWPTFRDGMIVNQIVEAAWRSSAERRWVRVNEV